MKIRPAKTLLPLLLMLVFTGCLITSKDTPVAGTKYVRYTSLSTGQEDEMKLFPFVQRDNFQWLSMTGDGFKAYICIPGLIVVEPVCVGLVAVVDCVVMAPGRLFWGALTLPFAASPDSATKK